MSRTIGPFAHAFFVAAMMRLSAQSPLATFPRDWRSDSLRRTEGTIPGSQHQRESNMSGGVLDRFRIDGKVALVTGGARGLGRVIADALASAGADVVLSARQVENASGAAEVIAADFGKEGDRPGRRRDRP